MRLLIADKEVTSCLVWVTSTVSVEICVSFSISFRTRYSIDQQETGGERSSERPKEAGFHRRKGFWGGGTADIVGAVGGTAGTGGAELGLDRLFEKRVKPEECRIRATRLAG